MFTPRLTKESIINVQINHSYSDIVPSFTNAPIPRGAIANPRFYTAVANPNAVPSVLFGTITGIEGHNAHAYIE